MHSPIIPIIGDNIMQPEETQNKKGTKRGPYDNKPRKGLRYRQSQFAYFLGKLIVYAYEELGVELTLEEGTVNVWRCDECGNWVSKHSKSSWHYRKLAQDINLFIKKNSGWRHQTTTEQHRVLGEYWKSLDSGCVWGGDFRYKDGCHYSYMEGKRFK